MKARMNGLKIALEDSREVWEVPHAVNSRYLSHDYFRYIGKFPPQIAAAFIEQFSIKELPVLDPMCGGGTSLIEAWLAGIPAIGMDVNPVAVLASRVATSPVPVDLLEKEENRILEDVAQASSGATMFLGTPGTCCTSLNPPILFGNEKFFTESTLNELSFLWNSINSIEDPRVADFCRIAFLGILRHVSKANVKKMNTEVDENKEPKPVIKTFVAKLHKMNAVNHILVDLPAPKVQVLQRDAMAPNLQQKSAGMVIIHPPYLSNTAFSESVQLPLAWLGYDHRTIWKTELRCRGSYVHEPDGLRKYIVGWHKILGEAIRATVDGGHICVVIGDGRTDFVRIPMGAITKEFGVDYKLRLVKEAEHRINNNTGWTLNRRMTTQHLLVFRKQN